jgi:hypothetical protein
MCTNYSVKVRYRKVILYLFLPDASADNIRYRSCQTILFGGIL